MKASGKFEVVLKPLDTWAEGDEGVTLGRMSLDKKFEGDLEADSKGEMLSAQTPTPGSAGYVAIEQVRGTLGGRRGSFVLQHFGIMESGEGRQLIEVVPDSGTAELEGLTGTMIIRIENGQHFYDLDYEVATAS